MSTTTPLVYRINVAEAKLGVSRSTIYRMVKCRQLTLVKMGKRASGVTAASVHAMIGGSCMPESGKKTTCTKSGSHAGSQPQKIGAEPDIER